MIQVNVLYKNKEAAQSFIGACEQSFMRSVGKVTADITASGKTKLVALSGPTCSGKTTTASLLTASLERAGKRARVLSIDDFYYSAEEMKSRGITDFESAAALDLTLLGNTVKSLIGGQKVLIPTFDFSVRRRIAMTEYIPEPNDIYVFEGIQSLYPEVTALFGSTAFKSIFISVATSLDICGSRFDKNELRLVRRIVRDHFWRAAPPEVTMSMWKTVRENEEKSIFPNAAKADFVISSLLPYEMFLLGKYFMRLTENYKAEDSGSALIYSLRERIAPISDNCIEKDMVPHNSVFREFIA